MNEMTMFKDLPDVMDIKTMQSALGIGRNAAYNLVKEKQIKHLKIGNSIRIPKAYLIDFVNNMTYNSINE